MLTLFALTLFVSSALLFLVQPMFAKLVLPLLGGTPTVWNTCVVFFQAMLLLGYAYAHATTRWLGVKRQAALHVVVVLLPALVLPIALGANWEPPTDRNPMAWLLGVLLISVGLPFFVVSSTAPLLQKWFSTTRHKSAADPYFLYMASNAGSMLALLSYPVLLEPTLRLQEQSALWTAGYGAMALLIVACVAVVHFTAAGAPSSSRAPSVPLDPASSGAPSPTLRLRWIALAAVPSSLMLGVTTFLSTDIAAVPLLWIVPLALYLGTFIVAFSAGAGRVQPVVDRLLPLVLLPLVLLLVTQITQPASLVMPLHVLAFGVLALVCHLELAASRPSTAHLTEFYLWISVGGLLGGLFNTILAPLVFVSIAEYPIAIVLACLLRVTRQGHATSPPRGWLTVVAAGALVLAAGALAQRWSLDSRMWLAMLGAALMVSFTVSRHATYFAAAVAVMLAAGVFAGPNAGDGLHAERTFFGVYRVTNDSDGQYRSLYHGTTLHGRQSRDPAREEEPLTYYHRSGPIGQVLTALAGPLERGHIGAVGLGTGSLAAYAGPQQRWTFYEIDPAVVRIAKDPRFFTYLHHARAAISIVQGDARLALKSAAPSGHDLLILDAFSSDAIPVHLITREALQVYENALAAHGVLAFHISNRHLSILPVLARLAAERSLTALTQFDVSAPQDTATGKTSSQWVVMARSADDLLTLATDARWARPDVSPDARVWTDDFSNIVSVINRF
jgi:spermidine synthase